MIARACQDSHGKGSRGARPWRRTQDQVLLGHWRELDHSHEQQADVSVRTSRRESWTRQLLATRRYIVSGECLAHQMRRASSEHDVKQ